MHDFKMSHATHPILFIYLFGWHYVFSQLHIDIDLFDKPLNFGLSGPGQFRYVNGELTNKSIPSYFFFGLDEGLQVSEIKS